VAGLADSEEVEGLAEEVAGAETDRDPVGAEDPDLDFSPVPIGCVSFDWVAYQGSV
jgi:hypothetical protein